MQSSAAVVFRGMVMLACLVAIPLAAIVGKSLPDLVKGILDGQWPGSSAPAYGSLGDAPRFEPLAPASPSGGVFAFPTDNGQPAVSVGRSVPDGQPPAQQGTRSRPGGADALSSPVVAAGLEAPVGPGSGSSAPAWPTPAVSPSGPDGLRPAVSNVSALGGVPASGPDRRPTSLPEAFTVAEPAAGASVSAVQARTTIDQFSAIQARLRQLGATYYLLESWGTQQQLHRFYCKVAVGGNPNYTHYFEATDSDPLQAMTRVLGQVEAWRASPP